MTALAQPTTKDTPKDGAKSAPSLREQLLALGTSVRRPTADVPAPELGAGRTIHLMALDGGERAIWEEEMPQKGAGRDKKVTMIGMRELTVQLHVADPETGERVLTKEDRPALSKWPASLLDRCFVEAQKLSALGKQATEEAIDELKNDRGSAG